MAGVSTSRNSRNMLLLHVLFCYWRTAAGSFETTERPLRFLSGNPMMPKMSDGEPTMEKYPPKWYDDSKILMNVDELQNPFVELKNDAFPRSSRATRLMPIDITILNTGTPTTGARASQRRIIGVDISPLARLPDLNLPISKSPFPDIDYPISENYMLDRQGEYPYNRWHFTKGNNVHHHNLSSNNETNEIIIFPVMGFPFKTMATSHSVINKKKDRDTRLLADLQLLAKPPMQSPTRSFSSRHQRMTHSVPELLAKFGVLPSAEVTIAKEQATPENRNSEPFPMTPSAYNTRVPKAKLAVPEIYMVLPEDLERYQKFREDRKKRSTGETEVKKFSHHQIRKAYLINAHPIKMRQRSSVKPTGM